MPAPRLTERMKAAMKRLCETEDHSEYVAYRTAIALERLGLISGAFLPRAQRTAVGQFPEYKVTLNKSGQQWCERHFAKVPRSD
jgi:hypothetical protein